MAQELLHVIGRRISFEEKADDQLRNPPANQPALACLEEIFRGDSATADDAQGINNHGDVGACVKQVRGHGVEGGRTSLLR